MRRAATLTKEADHTGYPAWRDVPVPTDRDVRCLMPPSNPRNHRFETEDDVAERNEKLVDRLWNKLPEIADAIDRCDPLDAPCNIPACASCARDYRVLAASELLKITDRFEGPHEIATIHLATVRADCLINVDLELEHDKLRKRLHRAGFGGSILIGGTEVAWKASKRIWILHVHLLAIGVSKKRWARLEQVLRKSDPDTPLKRRELKQEVRGISYLTKFVTFHRPFDRGPSGPSRACPLPTARLVELVEWLNGYDFEDFTFLFGARRRGGRFVPDS